MIDWEKLRVTVLKEEEGVLVETDRVYTMEAENRMVIFAGRQGEKGDPGGGGSGIAEWGYITGVLSNQTDLQAALDAKADTADLGTMAVVNDAPSDDKEYARKNGQWSEVVGGGGQDPTFSDGIVIESTDISRIGNAGYFDPITISDMYEKPMFLVRVGRDIQGYTYFKLFGLINRTGQDDAYCELIAFSIKYGSPPDIKVSSVSVDPQEWRSLLDLGDLALVDEPDSDGKVYARQNSDWLALGELALIDDASSDGQYYVRRNGAWEQISISGSPTWGGITGTLSNQTDLQNALDAKAEITDLAEPFDSTKTYVWGQFVIYYNELYMFNDTKNPGSWDYSKVVSVTIGEQLSNKAQYNHSHGSITTDGRITDIAQIGNGTSIIIGQGNGNLFRTTSSMEFDGTTDDKALSKKGTWETFLKDAPSDNKQYARKNGTWAEVQTGGTPAWGSISGTLSDQTDLATALSAKANTADLGDLASQDTVDWTTDITNKPTFGSLASKNSVDWDTDIDDIPATFPPSSHTHDDRYYTETEIDSLLADKADTADLGDLASQDTVDWTTDVTNKPTLGDLASKDTVDWTTDVTNKPTLGLLASKDTVDYATDVTNKPTLGSLASKNSVDWDTDIDDIPSTFPPSAHTHDDRYYTESEVDAELAKRDILYFTDQVVSAATSAQIMRIPASGTDNRITTDTVVLCCTYANPARIAGEASWQSYAGYVTFSGTCTAATTANVELGKKAN